MGRNGFGSRSRALEIMDDLEVAEEPLKSALDELRVVNRFLGGRRAVLKGLHRLGLPDGYGVTRIIDIGTGLADIPEYLVRWGTRTGNPMEVVAVDRNGTAVSYSRAMLDRRLPSHLRDQIRVERGEAFHLEHEDGSFHVACASLFAHHLDDRQVVALFREMKRVARFGIVVNDLHRHPVAYYGFRVLSHLLGGSSMVQHDGPISVLRAFKRVELLALAHEAGLDNVRVTWHWAFRWILTAGTHA